MNLAHIPSKRLFESLHYLINSISDVAVGQCHLLIDTKIMNTKSSQMSFTKIMTKCQNYKSNSINFLLAQSINESDNKESSAIIQIVQSYIENGRKSRMFYCLLDGLHCNHSCHFIIRHLDYQLLIFTSILTLIFQLTSFN